MHVDLIVLHQKWQEKYLIWVKILAKAIMGFEDVQIHQEHFDRLQVAPKTMGKWPK